MIRAKEGFARRRHKPGLAAAAAALVVMLVMLVGVHPISDNVVEHAELACAAAVLVLGLSFSLLGRAREPNPRPARSHTLPRLTTGLVRPTLRLAEARSLPLRQ